MIAPRQHTTTVAISLDLGKSLLNPRQTSVALDDHCAQGDCMSRSKRTGIDGHWLCTGVVRPCFAIPQPEWPRSMACRSVDIPYQYCALTGDTANTDQSWAT